MAFKQILCSTPSNLYKTAVRVHTIRTNSSEVITLASEDLEGDATKPVCAETRLIVKTHTPHGENMCSEVFKQLGSHSTRERPPNR